MAFNMMVRNNEGQFISGHSSPVFVGEKSFGLDEVFGEVESTGPVEYNENNLINVSYELSFGPLEGSNLNICGSHFRAINISAEGIYDSTSGHLWMIGCMHVPLSFSLLGRNPSIDCEILVEIQYRRLDAKTGPTIKGTIESRRMRADLLYFEPFDIFSRSPYTSEINESMWGMDLEMMTVLVSNTLSCIFVGLQLFDVQKHPDVLPNISVMMLAVLNVSLASSVA